MSTYTLFSDTARDTALTTIGGEMMGTQDTELLKQIFVAAGQGNSFESITGEPTDNTALAAYLQGGFPLILSVRNISVLTSGSPSDIASISVPSWISRYMLMLGNSSATAQCRIIQETGGALNSGTFGVYSGPNASGSLMNTASTANLPSGVGTTAPIVFTATLQTASTIYIHQTVNSANAGTVSVYLVLLPFL
jgi:hypothetical protein